MGHRLMVWAVTLAAAVACGGDDDPGSGQPSCGPATCSGCCQGSFCIDYPSDSACGIGGAACFSCAVGTRCEQGACEFPTDPCQQSCSGCCDNGLCRIGTAHDACGSSGVACQDCSSLAKTCDARTLSCVGDVNPLCNAANCAGCCQGDTCQVGDQLSACGQGGAACVSCNSDQSCSAGQCAGGAPPRVDIVLDRVQVHFPLIDCAETECDPQVEIEYSGKSYTSTIKAGNDVVFDEVLIANVPVDELLRNGFEAFVYDDDSPIPADWPICRTGLIEVTEQAVASGGLYAECDDYLVDLLVATISFDLKLVSN